MSVISSRGDDEIMALPLAEPTPLLTADGSKVEFGRAFTSSMADASWTQDQGWSELSFSVRRPLLVDPGMVGLHYGQVVFEGLKAHRLPDGRLALFRADAYARRMRRSAERLAMPPPPADLFVEAVAGLVQRDGHWLPDDPSAALYLRPVLIATEPSLALRSSPSYLFLVIAFATGGFFSDTPDPITVKAEYDFVRAAPGGTGAAKYAGNYAPTYLAQSAAARAGAQQVVWLDAIERRYVEELGGMNIFFVHRSERGTVVSTPPLSDSILPGVTRDSLIALARDLGHQVNEEPMTIDRWRDDARSGRITEAFACGTAATVTPIGVVQSSTGSWTIGSGAAGPVTLQLRNELRNAWYGLCAQRSDWLHTVDPDEGTHR
jgi:branched-chain amino acid aminotransferase